MTGLLEQTARALHVTPADVWSWSATPSQVTVVLHSGHKYTLDRDPAGSPIPPATTYHDPTGPDLPPGAPHLGVQTTRRVVSTDVEHRTSYDDMSYNALRRLATARGLRSGRMSKARIIELLRKDDIVS